MRGRASRRKRQVPSGPQRRRAPGRIPKDSTGIRTDIEGDAEEREQAYRRGRDLFGANTTLRAGRDVQIGDRITVLAGRASALARAGREERLEELREHYVESPNSEALTRALADRRVVILVGRPGVRRFTTALHLLDNAASGRVSRLAADTEFREIDDDPGPAHGYLVEPEYLGRLSATEADRLADVCTRNDCYLVIIALPDRVALRALGAYAEYYEHPDPGKLLTAHLRALVRSSDPPGTATRLVGLASTHNLWSSLGPAPQPRAVAHLASLLVAHARSGTAWRPSGRRPNSWWRTPWPNGSPRSTTIRVGHRPSG